MRLLVAVDTLGSISAAARSLGISQPSATSRIRSLEAEHRISLVRRSSRGSVLTSDGQAVCTWARAVLREAAVLESGLGALTMRRQVDLSVTASLTIAEQMIPGWLALMHEAFPDVRVSFAVENSTHVVESVVSGRADLGFVEIPGRLRAVSSVVVGEDRLVVVVTPGHRWTRIRRPLSREALLQESYVLREKGSGTRETFTAALRTEPQTAVTAGSTGAVVASAVSGIAPAVASALSVSEQLAVGRLVSIPTQLDLTRPLRAVWARGARLRGTAADLVHIARANRSGHKT